MLITLRFTLKIWIRFRPYTDGVCGTVWYETKNQWDDYHQRLAHGLPTTPLLETISEEDLFTMYFPLYGKPSTEIVKNPIFDLELARKLPPILYDHKLISANPKFMPYIIQSVESPKIIESVKDILPITSILENYEEMKKKNISQQEIYTILQKRMETFYSREDTLSDTDEGL